MMNTQGFPVELFNALFSDLDRGIFQIHNSPLSSFYDANYPPFNLSIDENTKDIQFEFAVAGLSLEDININFEDDYLKLDIKAKAASETNNWKAIKKGIRTSSSKTAYYVPFVKYDVDKAKAAILDGLLTIDIPVKEEAKPKRIEIKKA